VENFGQRKTMGCSLYYPQLGFFYAWVDVDVASLGVLDSCSGGNDMCMVRLYNIISVFGGILMGLREYAIYLYSSLFL